MTLRIGRELSALDGERVARLIRKQCSEPGLEDGCTVYEQSLSFYSKHRLVTLMANGPDTCTRRFLHDGTELFEITANRDAVYRINRLSGIIIDRITVLEYVTFLLGADGGRRPSAVALTSFDDIAWAYGTAEERRDEARASLTKHYRKLFDVGIDFPGEPLSAPAYRGFSLLDDAYRVRAYLQMNGSISIATISVAPYETVARGESDVLVEMHAGETQLMEVTPLVSMEELADRSDMGAEPSESQDMRRKA